METKVSSGKVLEAAFRWVRRGFAIVPVRPELVPNDKGKLSPIPWIRWQSDGPLRTETDVRHFWTEHPDAQLAILLENGLVTVDIDLKKLPGGEAPSGFPIPKGPGYCETTKGGGLHYVFLVKEQLDPTRSSRIVQLGDYVDVLAGGILVVAPTRFTNANQGYELLTDSLPVFPTMAEALGRYASWLPDAWRSRWEVSRTVTVPGQSRKGGVQDGEPASRYGTSAWPVDLAEVERAIAFIRSDRDLFRYFDEGYRDLSGSVDHSQTEWRITARLRDQGFSKAACWAIVRMCQHTKSPYDRRGRQYFEFHVWERLQLRRKDGRRNA